MNYKNNPSIDIEFLVESYDIEQLEKMSEEENNLLIQDLVEYSNELIEQILALRKEVNTYDKKLRLAKKENLTNYQSPYEDLHSDIYRDFTDHKSYDKFKDQLDKMLN